MYRNGCLVFRHLFVPGQQLHRNGYRCTNRIQRQRWGKHHPQKLCIHYPPRIQCQTARNSTRCTVPTAPPIPTRHLLSTAFSTTPYDAATALSPATSTATATTQNVNAVRLRQFPTQCNNGTTNPEWRGIWWWERWRQRWSRCRRIDPTYGSPTNGQGPRSPTRYGPCLNPSRHHPRLQPTFRHIVLQHKRIQFKPFPILDRTPRP